MIKGIGFFLTLVCCICLLIYFFQPHPAPEGHWVLQKIMKGEKVIYNKDSRRMTVEEDALTHRKRKVRYYHNEQPEYLDIRADSTYTSNARPFTAGLPDIHARIEAGKWSVVPQQLMRFGVETAYVQYKVLRCSARELVLKLAEEHMPGLDSVFPAEHNLVCTFSREPQE